MVWATALRAAKAVKEGAAKAAAKAAPAGTTESKPKLNGLTKPLPVSPACKKFFGQAEMSRVEVTKQLWSYIKAHNLQSDPADKKVIVCDDKLREFLNCNKRIHMTQIPGLISQHFKKAP